ncbi:hypothetical protein [Lacrimispora aerotolerans]|uniref:hypothetical protein n=1 Tax=Lacrimispora aerotolerans TaxID=36832 RepID=UPI000ACF1573|nr:hypothetical protein [Lacrimispora aerotolerans]
MNGIREVMGKNPTISITYINPQAGMLVDFYIFLYDAYLEGLNVKSISLNLTSKKK